jgi:hypothetical protein
VAGYKNAKGDDDMRGVAGEHRAAIQVGIAFSSRKNNGMDDLIQLKYISSN